MRFAVTALAAIAASLGVCVSAARAEQVPLPPVPTQWVTDNAGFLSAQTQASLDQKLQAYERATGHQVIVWIGDTTGDAALEDWTIRAFEKWRIGRKNLDDGVILFIFAKDRKIRIEVGYGLESVLPDATAAEIMRNEITPRLRAGDKDGAVTAGVDAILAVLSGRSAGETSPPRAASPNGSAIAAGGLIFFAFVIVFVIILTATSRAVMYHIPGRRYQGIPWIATFGGGGGSDFGGGYGGGFSAGGGMGGGGGASGGW